MKYATKSPFTPEQSEARCRAKLLSAVKYLMERESATDAELAGYLRDLADFLDDVPITDRYALVLQDRTVQRCPAQEVL